MSFNFAGLGSVAALGEQLDLYQRIVVGIGDLFDPAKIAANARVCKQAQEEALARMADAAEAQRNLDSRENALNTRERALEVRESRLRDLEERENAVAAREQAIGVREERYAEMVAAVRGIAA
jgi:hypothetical protein